MIRLLLSIPIGIAITFGLFVLMAVLIANDERGNEPLPETPPIEFVMEKPNDSVQQRTRTPPPPPPPPVTPPPPQTPQPEVSKVDPGAISMNLPTVDAGGFNAGIDLTGAMMQDGDVAPIARFNPKYPPQAERDGIEGWVDLKFTIDVDGSVIDIEILDSQPKRIFDRAARKALAKWVYKPKIEDGKPMQQAGLTVRLDFKLGE